jgi:hypothetical protein
MADLELLALKRLRSFALFSAKKRLKYEAAAALFGQAAKAYLHQKDAEKAAECCKQQARSGTRRDKERKERKGKERKGKDE